MSAEPARAGADSDGSGRRTPRRGPLPSGRRARLALLAVLLCGAAFATVIQSFSWNQTSHYDLTRALDSGTTTIDEVSRTTAGDIV